MDSSAIIVEQKCIVSKLWNGSKSSEFGTWKDKILAPALAKQAFTGGYTGYQVATELDQGGVNGPAYAGSAAVIADQTLQHNNRVTRLAGLVIESILPSATIRTVLSNPLYPFLTNGVLAYKYLIQECTLPLSIEDAAKQKRKWENLRMEELFSVDKFQDNTMHLWIEHVISEWELMPLAIRPPENDLCLLLIRGLSTKIGHVKAKLLSQTDCPPNLKYNAALAAQVFAAGPPIVLPQVARLQGEFRKPQLLDYLKEAWKLGIDAKTIHIKAPISDVNAFSRGKGKGRGRGGFSGKGRGSSSGSTTPSKTHSKSGNTTVVCFKCGGIQHTASQCSTTDDKAPNIKTLVAIQYPSHIVFRWPSSFTAEANKNPHAKSSNHISADADSDHDDDDEGEEGADEEDDDYQEDEELPEEEEDKMMRFINESVERDIAPRKGMLNWFSR